MQECQTVCRDMIAAKMVHLEKYAVMPNHVHFIITAVSYTHLTLPTNSRV